MTFGVAPPERGTGGGAGHVTPHRYPHRIGRPLYIRGRGSTTFVTCPSICPGPLIVFTGLSGSGKVVFSLRHDLRRRPERRWTVESLSAYALPIPGQMDKPDVDFIECAFARHLHRPEMGLAGPAFDVGAPSRRGTCACYAASAIPTARRADGRRASTRTHIRGPGPRAALIPPVPGHGAGGGGGARGSTAPCSTTWPSRASPGSRPGRRGPARGRPGRSVAPTRCTRSRWSSTASSAVTTSARPESH